MDLGRYQLGQTVHLFLACRNGSGVLTAPDDAPVARVYSGSALVESRRMPVRDRRLVTGWFHLPLFLGSAYAAGPHAVSLHYLLSGTPYVEPVAFTVAAGGHADGQITSMYFYRRPHADYVVHGTERGKILKGKNPSV